MGNQDEIVVKFDGLEEAGESLLAASKSLHDAYQQAKAAIDPLAQHWGSRDGTGAEFRERYARLEPLIERLHLVAGGLGKFTVDRHRTWREAEQKAGSFFR